MKDYNHYNYIIPSFQLFILVEKTIEFLVGHSRGLLIPETLKGAIGDEGAKREGAKSVLKHEKTHSSDLNNELLSITKCGCLVIKGSLIGEEA